MRVWRYVSVVLFIGMASVAVQVSGIRVLQIWMPHLYASAMLATALFMGPCTSPAASQPRHRALVWSTAVACGIIAYIVLQSGLEYRTILQIVPVLITAGLAEELIFRQHLPSAIARGAAIARLPNRLRDLTTIFVSQAAFAAVHVPRLLFEARLSDWALSTLVLGVTTTFAFGCLMVAFRRAGASTPLRTTYHAMSNLVSIAIPLSYTLQVTRLLGSTFVFVSAYWAITGLTKSRLWQPSRDLA